jgi:hypothetical protein
VSRDSAVRIWKLPKFDAAPKQSPPPNVDR